MSDISSSDGKKPMERHNEDLLEAMGQLSVTTDNSRKKLKLRKASKSLRALVDKHKPACKSIIFECCDGHIGIRFDSHWVLYTNEEYINVGDEIIVKRDDFKKAVFDDLASTLKNPKLQLAKFTTSVDVFEKGDLMEYYNLIHRVLESLKHQLSVKKVDLLVSSPSNLLSILPFLKSGFLEKISIWLHDGTGENNWRNDSTGMDKVALLEQWKQAEELELWNSFDTFPMEYATHFKRFRFNQDSFAGDKFIRIRDYISKLENFEQCTLSRVGFLYRPGLVHQVLGEPVSSNATEEVFHHLITDSDYYFEITKPMKGCDVKIVKKKRETHC